MSIFWDLINIEEYWEKREQFNPDRGWIAFYCKNCKTLVETEEDKEKKYRYFCKECGWDEIVIGTREWLISNYRIKL